MANMHGATLILYCLHIYRIELRLICGPKFSAQGEGLKIIISYIEQHRVVILVAI